MGVVWAQTNRKLHFLVELQSVRKLCPDCAEWIAGEANVCPHCGRRSAVGEIESLLLSIMSGKDEAARALALGIVGRVPSSVAASVLKLGLSDPVARLRQLAADQFAHAELRDASLVPVLVSRLEKEFEYTVRNALVEGLRHFGEEAVVELLDLVRRSPKSPSGKLAQKLLDDINSNVAS